MQCDGCSCRGVFDCIVEEIGDCALQAVYVAANFANLVDLQIEENGLLCCKTGQTSARFGEQFVEADGRAGEQLFRGIKPCEQKKIVGHTLEPVDFRAPEVEAFPGLCVVDAREGEFQFRS